MVPECHGAPFRPERFSVEDARRVARRHQHTCELLREERLLPRISGLFPLALLLFTTHRRVWVELAQTLIYLNSSGLAHRDIKPSNMLLEEGHDGRYHLKLCDLGMARLSGNRGNPLVTLGAGTPAYSPPECYQPSTPVNADARHAFPSTPSQQQQQQQQTAPWSAASSSPSAIIEDFSKWDIYSFAIVIWYCWYLLDPFQALSVPEVR